MDAILFVLRTGCQWKALDDTGICSSSSAYRRFREWLEAGVFERFWLGDRLEYDRLAGIDWQWLSVDGAMTQAPLDGKKPDLIQTIAARPEPSAASSPTGTVCR